MIHIINLPHRLDRLESLLPELIIQGVEYQLWSGIEASRPSMGIALAHQQIVRWAMHENLPEVIIAEDDVQFLGPGAFNFFLENKPSEFDLYLGGISYGRLLPDDTVSDFAGIHLYIIHRNFYTIFLAQDGTIDIDRSLKDKGKYVVCNPVVAIQRAGFSDNRKEYVDYSSFFKNRNLYNGSNI